MTAEQVKDEITKFNTAFAEFRTVNETRLDELKKSGVESPETKAKLEKLQAALDSSETKLDTRFKALEATAEKQATLDQKILDLEAALARKGQHVDPKILEDAKAQAILCKDIFFKALRFDPRGAKSLEEQVGGVDNMKLLRNPPSFSKALIEGIDTQGGYLSPLEYVQEILTNVVEYSQLRPVCRVRTTTRQGIQIPKRTTTAAASWVEEQGTRAETANPAFGLLECRTHEMYAMTKVSKQELEDSLFDLEGFLRAEFAEQFGVTESEAFVNGTSAGQPEGLLTNASMTSVNNGHATVLAADALIALYYDLKEAYLPNSYWVMNRSTLKTIRQLKDSQNQYLWAPGLRSDARPATILDRPYTTAPEMPAIGNATYPIVFGDFRRGYIIVDRLLMEMMNDPYSSKSTGMVEFSARRRVGGQVAIPEALRKLYMAV